MPRRGHRGEYMGKTVVSGGGGFVGSHVCERLIADSHEVIALDNFCTGRPQNLDGLANEPRFDLIECDAAEAPGIAGPVNAVLHLASPASPPDFASMPIEIMKAGSFATHHLLELARDHDARFLLASTSEVYGDPQEHPQRETYWGHVNPVGERAVYDEAKRYAEALTMAYHRHEGLSTGIARIFNTYGPRMRHDDGRVVTNFITQALRNEPLTVYGDGMQTRSFAYVSDTVDGILRLLDADEARPVNIGNPNEFTVLEFAEQVLAHTGSSSKIAYADYVTQDDPRQRRPDISRARELLGWEPRVGLDEGLPKTIDYLRDEIGAQA